MSSPTLTHLSSVLWTEKVLSDVEVEFSEKVFSLHKILLYQSPYLRRLLEEKPATRNFRLDTNDKHITVDGMNICLASLYGINPELDERGVFGVLAAAYFLELDELCEVCCNFMQEHITPALFLSWHSISLSWEGGAYQERLRDLLDIFLCRTASKETCTMLSLLPNEDLERVLTSNTLWIAKESDRFHLILEVFKGKVYGTEEDSEVSLQNGVADSEPSLADSEPSCFDPNNCKTSTTTFFESLLEPGNIYYHNFSFPELVNARKQAEELRFDKIVDCINKSLWSKSRLEHMIFYETWKTNEMGPLLPNDETLASELDEALKDGSDLEDSLSTLRFSTEISDITSFSGSGQFTSEQVYFAGSLFRVVLSIPCDEGEDDPTIGIYVQRTLINDQKTCCFCDPRTRIDVNLEFSAGTRILEVIELDGQLAAPCSNRGYSKFLLLSQLGEYLSPAGTLRVTVILKMLFPTFNQIEK